jgi:hypothetical protein
LRDDGWGETEETQGDSDGVRKSYDKRSLKARGKIFRVPSEFKIKHIVD